MTIATERTIFSAEDLHYLLNQKPTTQSNKSQHSSLSDSISMMEDSITDEEQIPNINKSHTPNASDENTTTSSYQPMQQDTVEEDFQSLILDERQLRACDNYFQQVLSNKMWYAHQIFTRLLNPTVLQCFQFSGLQKKPVMSHESHLYFCQEKSEKCTQDRESPPTQRGVPGTEWRTVYKKYSLSRTHRNIVHHSYSKPKTEIKHHIYDRKPFDI